MAIQRRRSGWKRTLRADGLERPTTWQHFNSTLRHGTCGAPEGCGREALCLLLLSREFIASHCGLPRAEHIPGAIVTPGDATIRCIDGDHSRTRSAREDWSFVSSSGQQEAHRHPSCRRFREGLTPRPQPVRASRSALDSRSAVDTGRAVDAVFQG